MGRRVLVTRALQQASPLVEALQAAGCEPIVVPAIGIEALEDGSGLDAAVAGVVEPDASCEPTRDRVHVTDGAPGLVAGFDWVVFTSANGVEALARRLRGRAVQAKVAVIGPATARAVEAAGMRVALVPEVPVGESLAAVLVAEVARGARRFLLVRAERAREVVPEALRAAGAEVVEVAGYRTVVPAESVERVRVMFAERAAWPEAAVFTSGSTAVNLAALLEAAGVRLPEEVRCVSIGPITSAAVRGVGWRVDAEAQETTVAGLVEAVMLGTRDKG
jgi:uroporphyrinogen-III synthase